MRACRAWRAALSRVNGLHGQGFNAGAGRIAGSVPVPVPEQMRSRARAAAAAAGAGAGWLAAVSAAPATCAPSRRSVRETWTSFIKINLIQRSCLTVTERTRDTRLALKFYRVLGTLAQLDAVYVHPNGKCSALGTDGVNLGACRDALLPKAGAVHCGARVR